MQLNNIWKTPQKFTLENGYQFDELTIGYQTFGTLNADKSNVVWICHALTANANPVEWWPGLVGENCIINPSTHFIVCANIIGSCYGSTHPLSINTETGQPYFSNFPLITIRDMVAAHMLLADELQINQIQLLMGGSLGGQQVLEWSIMQPHRIKNILVIASNAFHSPFGIAFNESQRLSIYADQTYKQHTFTGGLAGLKAARSIALLSYRTYDAYMQTQHEIDANKTDDFKAASYQRYQGEKLAKRFDAYSYISLTKSMDSHHVGRGRNSVPHALSLIKAKALCIGISSDILFPPSEQSYLAENIENSIYELIHSDFGHDGFLLETTQLTALIKKHQLLDNEN